MFDRFKVAERLREVRAKRGLLQREMAAFLGISIRSYHMYEQMNSAGGIPRISSLINICDKLDISTDYIFGRTDNPHSHK
jgi:transcriptional regulator with XRE-family HTH domain